MTKRYFVTYTGIRLPFRLVNELQASEVENRNTFFLGHFDGNGRLTGFDRYTYHDNGKLSSAEITDIDGEMTMLVFSAEGDAAWGNALSELL